MKRLLAMLLAVMMVLAMVPVSVSAEAAHDNGHLCADGCENVTWQPWTGKEKNGHYYLTEDVTITSQVILKDTNSLHLCLNGHKVKGNDSVRLFAMEGNAKLTIFDCTTKLDAEGKFLSGGSLSHGFNGTCGGAIYAKASAQVTLKGICLEGNSCSATSTGGWTGGAIHVRETTKTTIENCRFTGNTAQEGAALLARAGATVVAKDTVFSGNASAGGGGAIFATNSTVTLERCLVEGNKSNGNGGSALHIANSTVFTIKDTIVTGNISTAGNAWKGALYQDNAVSRFVLTGKVVIDDNFVDNGKTERNILFAFTGSKLGIDQLAAGSTVSILTQNWNTGKDFEYATVAELLEVSADTDITKWDPTWIFYEDSQNYIYYDGATKLLRFIGDVSHIHCLCGDGLGQGCDHTQQIFIPWGDDESEKGKLPNESGYYYLTGDVSLSAGANVSTGDDIHVCLNGHTVTANHATEGKVEDQAFYMTRNGKLTISDCTAKLENGVYTAGRLTGGSKGIISQNKLNDNATENTLVIYDGIFSGNTNTTDGGVFNLTAGSGKLTIYDGLFTGNSVQGNGGVINAAKGSTVEILGGTFEKNTAVKNGGAVAALEATLTVKNAVFTGNTGDNGGAFYLNGGTASFDAITVTENTAKTAGGVAAVSNGCKLTIASGEYRANIAPNGGALCLMSNSQTTVTGGSFTENTVTNNGAVFYVSRTALLTLAGGTVTGNTAGVHGGGVFVDYDGLLTISGGTITGNRAGTTGGGVSIHGDAGTFTLGGDPVIADNTVGASRNDLYLRGDSVVALGQLTQGARIGIIAEQLPRYISDTVSYDPTGYFFCDQSHREVRLQEQKLYFDFSGEHQHCLCAGSDEHCDHENLRWAAWEATDALPTDSGNYYLLTDVTLPTAAILKGTSDVRICLNGHTITAAHSQENTVNDRAFILQGQAKLTISDCTAAVTDGVYTAGRLTGGTQAVVNLAVNASATFHLYDGILAGNNRADNVGGAVTLLNTPQGSNVFNMYGGLITDNWAKGNGGAVYVKEGCTFNLYGGSLTGNKSTTFHGGAVAVVADGTFNIYGGEISGNTASKNGGGIFVEQGALNIYGGKVSGNYAGSNGGAISAIGGTICMKGGSVSGNTAKAAAGAISLSTKSQLTVTGGNLDANKAQDGGALCIMSNSKMTLSGGSVGYNKAGANGGGIYVSRTGTLVMNGGSVHHNSCPRNGGGLFLNNAVFTLSGGNISYNTADTTAGGILVGSSSTVKMYGGNVRGNTAVRGAGAVIQGKATFDMYGGKFQGNVAEIEAGAIYVSTNSFFTLHEGEFLENEAQYRGGAILANASFTIAGGDIHHNKVTGSEKYSTPYAGGVVIIGESEKTLTMTGGIIRDNYSAGTGGGMRINYMNTLEMTGGVFRNNVAEKTAGGLEIYGYANITGGLFEENRAGTVGGGLRVVSQVRLHLKDTVFRGNSAATRGGGVYLAKGNWSVLEGCTFTENISGEQGSAIYSWDELTLDGCTITGNTSGTVGAVYLCSANFDGQSYVLSVPKLAGDLVIRDNNGPDAGLYFEAGAVGAIDSKGLGKNAHVEVYLAEGVLTNTLFGSYNYEGGAGKYLVTYGDRSEHEYEEFALPEGMEQPAPVAPAEEAPKTDWLLYGLVGLVGLVAVGGGALLIARKKKQ